MNRQSVIVCGVVSSGVAGLIGGGLLLLRWWRRRSTFDNPYEKMKSVNEYMGLHYASPSEYITFSFAPKDALDFPLRCAELCEKHKSVRCSIMNGILVLLNSTTPTCLFKGVFYCFQFLPYEIGLSSVSCVRYWLCCW